MNRGIAENSSKSNLGRPELLVTFLQWEIRYGTFTWIDRKSEPWLLVVKKTSALLYFCWSITLA